MRTVAGIGCILVLLLPGWRVSGQTLNLGPPDTALCNSKPFILDAGPGFTSYQWSTGASGETILVSHNGEYSVTVTDTSNNTLEDSIYVTLYSSPIAVFLGNNTCLGGSISFIQLSKHQDSIATWLWNFGDGTFSNDSQPSPIYTAPGIYQVTLTLTTVQGCSDSVTNRVQVYAAPYVSAGPNDTIDVNNDTVQLNGVTQALQFSWEPTQYLLDSTDSSTLDPVVVVNYTTQFVLTATDSLGCMNSDTVLVFVNQYPIANDVTVNINAETTVVIDVQANDNDPNNEKLTTTIVIPPSSGAATVVNNDSIQYAPDAHFTGLDTLVYQVCNTGDPPLCATAYVFISVSNIPPIIHNDTILTSVNTPDSVNVLANDTDPLGQPLNISYLSPPVNGIDSDLGNGQVEYIPNEGFSGTDNFYYVACNNGIPALCDTGYVFVTVLKLPLKVSNSFSPNGDGILDYFIIEGISAYPNNHLLIFSRWGDKIFDQSGYNNGWNGTSTYNENVPDGVYFYSLDLGDGSKSLTGWVMLKR